ncbi:MULTISPECIES: hypothetical protein [unclassified Corynebacterium]|uniref:hypothetical protein n=1 Tax=unclassified Corynebacterium TaxID=2624378 RepID=UPI0029C9E88B|nr:MULTISPECIES: hypothetical protein [unclassified Corynebacterium]WPF66914.1 hypothetical protein OLX12_04100 [Corynebacterium sp. 22KM0430]WPF69401.1 hypothetical protein OLW90_04095 [Corynebacterium sp. 21KM1197]
MGKYIQNIDKEVARWVHVWAAAALHTYEVINSISIVDSPVEAISQKDTMSMVLVSAVRNVVRGAESLFGKDCGLVQNFNSMYPHLKKLRDVFEHYEDYVVGNGISQREGRKRNGRPLGLDVTGLEISASSGGQQGHQLYITVIERGSDGKPKRVTYEVLSKAIALAACRLARDVIDAVGMLDERHLSKCSICSKT